MSESKQGFRLARVLLSTAAIALVLAALAIAAAISHNRALQVDEFEHVKVAYNMRTGLVPYTDFHQGHHLLLHSLLLPVIDVADPIASFGRAR
ncbi:MAG: hypothetical protein AAGC55_14920, partial [Myxococcota bacterium]